MGEASAKPPSARHPIFYLLLGLGGVAVAAIPWLGALAGLIGGIAMLTVTLRDRRSALLHRCDLPVTPIAELAPGQVARLRGRLVSEPTATAPISGRPAVYASVTGKRSVMRNENETRLEPRHLGEALELEDGTGRARIPLRNVHVLSRHLATYVEHNAGPLPALRALYPGLPESQHLECEELRLEAGDELWVVGRIEKVEALAVERAEDYRAGAAKRVDVVARDDEGLRVTNVDPSALERTIRSTPAFLAIGAVWIVAATASAGYWGWRFFY
jgi:hypothetical protein